MSMSLLCKSDSRRDRFNLNKTEDELLITFVFATKRLAEEQVDSSKLVEGVRREKLQVP